MEIAELSARRPYLLRAFYDWLLDNDLTPHLVANVNLPGIQVPMEFARDGQIVLNIAPAAVGNLLMDNDAVSFNARFGGVPRQVLVPMAAVMAIYARENGAGTMFEPETAYELAETFFEQVGNERIMSVIDGDLADKPSTDDEPPQPPRGGRATLRVVK